MQAAQNIKGTPHAGNRWKNNLDGQLTRNGYTFNNVDRAFYTYHRDCELQAMLSTTVNDFLLSFKTTSIRDTFFKFMSDAFDITTPGYKQELKFLSLRIYQSKHGISMDQTQYIYTNILLEWFKDKDNIKQNEIPIKAHPTYKYSLSESEPLLQEDLKTYERTYNSAYNRKIGKLLQIQQWSHPDLNYAISRLAVYSKNSTVMAFQVLDHLMSYLYHHMH